MSDKYHNVSNISIDIALEAVKQGLKIAKKMGVMASITVVDRSMNLVAFGKADGATPHSIETSRKKANTSASTGKDTGWMQGDLAISLPKAVDKLTNIPGGFPIKFSGKLVGGIGVAGGTVAQDSEIAMKTLRAIESE